MSFRFVVCLVALLCSSAMAQQGAESRRYSLKQSEPDVGTSIRKPLVSNSAVPVNLRYDEMSDEHKAIIKNQYESMGADDEPPFPRHGLAPLYKQLSQLQNRVLAEGLVTIVVDVDESGKAIAAQVLKAPDRETGRYFASVLMLQDYKPAVCDGRPCRMQYPFRMDLKVRRP